MTRLRTILVAASIVLLAACRQSASPPTHTAAAPAKPDTRAAATTPPTAPETATHTASNCIAKSESFDAMVCRDPVLAQLDRDLADTFAQVAAKTAGAKALDTLRHGWTDRRDACMKVEDKPACLRVAYQTEIVMLRLDRGLVQPPKAVPYDCVGNGGKPLTAAFYRGDPSAVVLTWGSERAIVPIAPSASGARYAAAGIEFREHQGDATVDFRGSKFTCRSAR